MKKKRKKLVEISGWNRWKFWKFKEVGLNGVNVMFFGTIGDIPIDINIYLLGIELLQIMVLLDESYTKANTRYRKKTYIRLALFNFSLSITVTSKKLFKVT